MAVSRKVERDLLRENYLTNIINHFTNTNEEVLRVKSNEIAIPVVGCEGNEDFIVITVKVPTGANKGLEPYDGYELAEDYELKTAEKIRKKAESERKKKPKRKRQKKSQKIKQLEKKRKKFPKKGSNPLIFLENKISYVLRPKIILTNFPKILYNMYIKRKEK